MKSPVSEREFFWALLNLGQVNDLEGLLEQSLDLILGVVGAHRGYIELRHPELPNTWCRSTALAAHEVSAVQHSISSGIIGEALASGETIHTASAIADPRFASRVSVQQHQIEAAICAPIGRGATVGVVYVQGRVAKGPFTDEDVQRVELFARHLAPYADRLLERIRSRHDPTSRYRRLLRAESLIGRSAALADLLEQLSLVAPLDLSVLLIGPTGSGKTEVARVIHESSGRKGRFVELNCAALPSELVESELFGAEKGAHSTATSRVMGKVEAARGGTLFLDEVGELPLTSQAKLLQFLQSGAYWPLGSSRPRRSDARVIAATNVDLERAVDERRFRSDLYYRLNVFTVCIPGLDERRDDILPLAEYFLDRVCARHDFPAMYLLPSAKHKLQSMSFPGNIRELLHTVERAAIRAAAEPTLEIGARHLVPHGARSSHHRPIRTYAEHLAAFQRSLLESTLEQTNGNVSAAARLLDITRSHFYTLMRTHNIEPRRRS